MRSKCPALLVASALILVMHQVLYTVSHYGEDESRNGAHVFREDTIRNDRRKETWMGALVGLWVGFEDVFGGLFIDLPMTYQSVLDTKVVDSEEGEIFSDNQTNSPAVQDPSRIRMILGRRW